MSIKSYSILIILKIHIIIYINSNRIFAIQIIFNFVSVFAAHSTSIFNLPFKCNENSYIKIGNIEKNNKNENTGVIIDKTDITNSETKKKFE